MKPIGIRKIPILVRILLLLALMFGAYKLLTWSNQHFKTGHAHDRYDQQIQRNVEAETRFVNKVKNKPEKEQMSLSDAKRIVRILHEGVPDRYTSDGRLVSGIAPDPIEAAKIYEYLLQKGETDITQSYAMLREFGPPEVKNTQQARWLYGLQYQKLSEPGDKYDILEAIERVSHPSEQWHIARIRSDLAADLAAKAASKTINIINHKTPVLLNKGNPTPVRTVDEDVWLLPDGAFRAPDVVPTVNTVRADAHNAHDSGVTKTVKVSVDRLRESIGDPVISAGVAVKQVRDTINNSNISVDRKKNAIQALDTIERNNHTLTASNTTEVDLLNLVWNRIHHDDNKENQDSLRDNLLNELSECVEHQKTVCTSGRFNRIISSLNGVDDLVDIKPKWAIQRELVDKAGVLYQEKINALDEVSRTAVNALDATPEQEASADEILHTVKQGIRDDFKRSYVDTGILTEDALNVEVDKWIDAI